MMLSNKDIIDRLGNTVIISPFESANVNTSTVDVRLGEFYYEEQKPKWHDRLLRKNLIYNIWDKDDIDRVWGIDYLTALPLRRQTNKSYRGIDPEDLVIFLPPKTTILAHTVEFIGGRLNITTQMNARSSYGRNFIEVCKCAGRGDNGYFNRWTMEITNNSYWYKIPLVVGRRIAQIAFMETGELIDSRDDYAATGNYQDHNNVADLELTWRPDMMKPRLDRDRDIKRRPSGHPFSPPADWRPWRRKRWLQGGLVPMPPDAANPGPRATPRPPYGRIPQ